MLPFSSDIRQKLGQLLYLSYNSAEIELGREKIGHFEQEKS